MLTAASLQDQVRMVRDDPLRVLVVGAGVAGLTLAQLLRNQGWHPVLAERGGPDMAGGYMLGLMPLVEPVLARLGVSQDYLDRSTGMHRYRLHASTGRAVREYSLDELLAEFGHSRGIDRGALVRVLAAAGAPVAFHSTVVSLQQTHGTVRARLAEGAGELEAEFDVVVAADGNHSATRDLVLGPDRVATFDTGWGGWVAWADEDADPDLYEETWGAGFFLGAYPVQGRVGMFVGGHRSDTAQGARQFAASVRDRLRSVDGRTERALSAVASEAHPYYWSFVDSRCATWSVGRVVMLGDAAAGFLPTAGIGAAMAMESAAALQPWLTSATPGTVPQTLAGYERAQRPRVESAHDYSRQLARLMFHRSRAVASVRDTAARLLTLRMAVGPIRKLHETALCAQRGGWVGRGVTRSARRRRMP